MRRREFIAGLGAVAWPLAARAQQGDGVRRIGVLMAGDENDPVPKTFGSAFKQALVGLGWTDGRIVRMDIRWAGDDINRIRALAQELVGSQPDIIVTDSTLATATLQRETRTIPIVFVSVTDPVASGIVTRLDRPSGNITGFDGVEAMLGGNWLELLLEIAPGLKRVAIIFNPDTALGPADIPFNQIETRHMQSAARTLGLRLLVFNATTDTAITPVFATLVEHQVGAVLMGGSAIALPALDQILSHAVRFALPTMFLYSLGARAGALLSYGADTSGMARQMGAYTGRILKGEKPGDLPVQQPTKFEFVINFKTAEALIE
jgi:putative ABC transport system substrate-binding protein